MLFALFVILNAVLLLRPADLIAELRGIGIYYLALGATWLVALPRLADPAILRRLTGHPVTWCVLALQAVVVLSHLSNGRVYEARQAGILFLEVPLYFFLLLVVLDTPEQLFRFLPWLAGLIAVQTAIAVLQYYDLVQFPAVATLLHEREYDPATGEFILVPRLRGLGFFHDPNDLCLLLVVGMGICAWQLLARPGAARVVYLALALFLAFAVVLTQSRGGLMAVLAGVATYLGLRWGWRRAVLLLVIGLPLMLAALGGRIARVNTTEGTAQQRIGLWRDALQFLRESPLLGIGMNQFSEEVGLVAHNSFLHCYAELGFLGGTCFLATFALTLWSLQQLRAAPERLTSPDVAELALFWSAIVVGFAVGCMSVSRPYTVPTYLVLGLGVALSQVGVQPGLPPVFVMGNRVVLVMGSLSVLFVFVMYLFVRFSVIGAA